VSSRGLPILVRALARFIPREYRAEVLADLLDARDKPSASQILKSALDCRREVRRTRREVGSAAASPGIAGLMGSMLADVRLAVRQYRERPLMSLTAVATLALACGLATALFTATNAVLWRPLGYANQATVAFLNDVGETGHPEPMSPARGLDLRGLHSLAQVALLEQINTTMESGGHAERVQTGIVSANFFDVLGRPAAIGRTFTATDTRRDLIVLSAAYWRARFGGDRAVVGSTVTVNGTPHLVAGVMADDFYWHDGPVFWTMADETDVPAGPGPRRDPRLDRGTGYLRAIARVAPEATFDSANAELAAMSVQLARDYPLTDSHRGTIAVPIAEQFFGSVKRPLMLLLAATGFVMLLAIVNVANLLLIRLTERSRELAVRTALGATRGRIFRQLVIEGVVLTVSAGLASLALARGALAVLARLAPVNVERLDTIAPDWRPFAFAAGVSLVGGLLLGALPAWTLRRARGLSLSSGRGGISLGAPRLRRALVAIEVALALVLVVGASLFGESLLRLRRVDVGFNPNRLLTFDVAVSPRTGTTNPVPYFEDLLTRIRHLPGVEHAAGAITLPIGGDDFGTRVIIEGKPLPTPGAEPRIGWQIVSPGWFDTLGIPVRGRDFTASDDGHAGQVVIVNETFAKRNWPGENPIGLRLRLGRAVSNTPWMTVIAVVGDIRHSGPATPPRPEVYEPYFQSSLSFLAMAVRTAGDPFALAPAIRSVAADVDPSQPISNLQTMDVHLARAYGDLRFLSTLTLTFGALALTLAALGVYGVLGSAAGQRRREFALRSAIGASPSSLRRLVLGSGLQPAIVGLVAGLFAARFLSTTTRGLLFETAPSDPIVHAVAAGVIVVSALAACWLPARRAARTDAVEALRDT
jgi:putative ABC transport system permease protein